jgi:hypothetical protein
VELVKTHAFARSFPSPWLLARRCHPPELGLRTKTWQATEGSVLKMKMEPATAQRAEVL